MKQQVETLNINSNEVRVNAGVSPTHFRAAVNMLGGLMILLTALVLMELSTFPVWAVWVLVGFYALDLVEYMTSAQGTSLFERVLNKFKKTKTVEPKVEPVQNDTPTDDTTDKE